MVLKVTPPIAQNAYVPGTYMQLGNCAVVPTFFYKLGRFLTAIPKRKKKSRVANFLS